MSARARFARRHICGDGLGGAGDFLTAAVVEGDDQIEFGVVARQRLGILQHGDDDSGLPALRGHRSPGYARLTACKFRHILADETAEQFQQKHHFRLGRDQFSELKE
jgi:hypothetical protein